MTRNNDGAATELKRKPRVRQTRAEENRRPLGTALNAHSRDYKVLVKARRDLAASIGTELTPVQALLVEQAAQLRLRLVQADNQVVAGQPMTAVESKHYCALSNAMTRVLLRLGLDEKAQKKPSRDPSVPDLKMFLAEHARQKAEATA